MALLASCASPSSNDASLLSSSPTPSSSSEGDGNLYQHPPGIRQQGFELMAFDDQGRASLELTSHYRMEVRELPEGGREVWVYLSDPAGWQYAYFTLAYDPAREHPVSVIYGSALPGEGSEVLRLAPLNLPGLAAVAQIYLEYPRARGAAGGEHLLARLRFAPEPYPVLAGKGLSQLGAQNDPIPQELSVDDNLNLTFKAVLRGDANADLSVDFADVTLFVTDFGKSVGPGGAQQDSDFNGDGSVGFADVNILVSAFGTSVDSFELFTAPTADDLSEANIDSAQLLITIPATNPTEDPHTGYPLISSDLNPVFNQLDQFIALRPVGLVNNQVRRGTPSDPLELQLAPNITDLTIDFVDRGVVGTDPNTPEPDNMGRMLIHEFNLDGDPTNDPAWSVGELLVQAFGTVDGTPNVNVTRQVGWLVDGDFVATPWVIDPDTGTPINPDTGQPIDFDNGELPFFDFVDTQGLTDDPSDDALRIKGRNAGRAEVRAFVPITREAAQAPGGADHLIVSVNAIIALQIFPTDQNGDPVNQNQILVPLGSSVSFLAIGLAYENYDPATNSVNLEPDTPLLQGIDITREVNWIVGSPNPTDFAQKVFIADDGLFDTSNMDASDVGSSFVLAADYPRFGELVTDPDTGEQTVRQPTIMGGFSPASMNQIQVEIAPAP